ncbi:hypothetical protein ETB97_008638 [Aspergillus alliaceus]|uniref:Uncharacterized protein n=1 Tax=Petromyces alliaceus TaxID=209559 RepID=A0A8H6EBN2_PETAA|nr:hypothetical protein ETB97_008638 [Aspergillus burnettii]
MLSNTPIEARKRKLRAEIAFKNVAMDAPSANIVKRVGKNARMSNRPGFHGRLKRALRGLKKRIND